MKNVEYSIYVHAYIHVYICMIYYHKFFYNFYNFYVYICDGVTLKKKKNLKSQLSVWTLLYVLYIYTHMYMYTIYI